VKYCSRPFNNLVHSSRLWHLYTCRTTSTSSPTVVVVCSDQLPSGHASSHEHTTVGETAAPVLRTHVRVGTVCHPTGVRTSATNSLSDFRQRFYLGVSWPRRTVTICLFCFNKRYRIEWRPTCDQSEEMTQWNREQCLPWHVWTVTGRRRPSLRHRCSSTTRRFLITQLTVLDLRPSPQLAEHCNHNNPSRSRKTESRAE